MGGPILAADIFIFVNCGRRFTLIALRSSAIISCAVEERSLFGIRVIARVAQFSYRSAEIRLPECLPMVAIDDTSSSSGIVSRTRPSISPVSSAIPFRLVPFGASRSTFIFSAESS